MSAPAAASRRVRRGLTSAGLGGGGLGRRPLQPLDLARQLGDALGEETDLVLVGDAEAVDELGEAAVDLALHAVEGLGGALLRGVELLPSLVPRLGDLLLALGGDVVQLLLD